MYTNNQFFRLDLKPYSVSVFFLSQPIFLLSGWVLFLIKTWGARVEACDNKKYHSSKKTKTKNLMSVGRRRLLQHNWYKVSVLHVVKYHLHIKPKNWFETENGYRRPGHLPSPPTSVLIQAFYTHASLETRNR